MKMAASSAGRSGKGVRRAVVGLELEQQRMQQVAQQQAAAALGASGHWVMCTEMEQAESSGREADGRARLEFSFSDLTNMDSVFSLKIRENLGW
jgi:uncharacterized membrane protein YcjF (UPF0283 family)